MGVAPIYYSLHLNQGINYLKIPNTHTHIAHTKTAHYTHTHTHTHKGIIQKIITQ